MHHKLDRKLVLLVREKLGDLRVLDAPSSRVAAGEILRGAAERVLGTPRKLLGSVPCDHKFRLPKAIQTESPWDPSCLLQNCVAHQKLHAGQEEGPPCVGQKGQAE